MSWADCGEDSRGRPIGYAFQGECDETGCPAVIDRGLGYACGGMHGFLDAACDGYFCPAHLFANTDGQFVCRGCFVDNEDSYVHDNGM